MMESNKQKYLGGLIKVFFGLAFYQIISFSTFSIAQEFPSEVYLQNWDGPRTGPVAQINKTVVYIASDFKNGGVAAVYRGFEVAARKLGWKIRFENGAGSKVEQEKIFSAAIASHPDGIIIAGFGVNDFHKLVVECKKAKIVLIGWHAGDHPGPTENLFVNITTDASIVAKMAVDVVIQDAKAKKKKVGVVIFNDDQFAIANLKVEVMKKEINVCKGYTGCKVLAVKNVLISEAGEAMPDIIPTLISTYGNEWTYGLAINDIYFDTIYFPLVFSKRTDIVFVSAGDGSSKAISRIQIGKSQQYATVAEPLRLQGFQIADELNRSFAGKPPSGYISKPQLITQESLLKAKNELVKLALLDYEEAYYAIWNGTAKLK